MGGVISCFNPEYEKLKKYLDDGGDPNARTNEKSQLFLYRNNVRCFKLLLERGADPNQPFHVTFPSPLVVSLGWDVQDRAMLLIQYGANVHWKDPYGHSVIHYVDASRQRKIFEALLDRGVDINSKDNVGVTLFERHLLRYYFNRSDKYLEDLIFLANCGSRIDLKKFSELKKFFEELPTIRPLMEIWTRRKWLVMKCSVKFLSLHQRAVITANHPLRKLERGEFVE
jgi:hypothetical protein